MVGGPAAELAFLVEDHGVPGTKVAGLRQGEGEQYRKESVHGGEVLIVTGLGEGRKASFRPLAWLLYAEVGPSGGPPTKSGKVHAFYRAALRFGHGRLVPTEGPIVLAVMKTRIRLDVAVASVADAETAALELDGLTPTPGALAGARRVGKCISPFGRHYETCGDAVRRVRHILDEVSGATTRQRDDR
jgi:hypothetical protein